MKKFYFPLKNKKLLIKKIYKKKNLNFTLLNSIPSVKSSIFDSRIFLQSLLKTLKDEKNTKRL